MKPFYVPKKPVSFKIPQPEEESPGISLRLGQIQLSEDQFEAMEHYLRHCKETFIKDHGPDSVIAKAALEGCSWIANALENHSHSLRSLRAIIRERMYFVWKHCEGEQQKGQLEAIENFLLFTSLFEGNYTYLDIEQKEEKNT